MLKLGVLVIILLSFVVGIIMTKEKYLHPKLLGFVFIIGGLLLRAIGGGVAIYYSILIIGLALVTTSK